MSSLERLCVECGQRFERRHEESVARFSSRIYCSNKCVQTYINRRKFLRKHPEEKDMTP